MSSRILAIDIQQDRISSVLLTHGLKGIRIIETASQRIVDKTQGDPFFQAVQDTLIETLEAMGTLHDRCIISLPSRYFFFRTIELPFKNRKKNSQILSLELEPYLPCPVESVESDFYLLDNLTTTRKNSKEAVNTTMAGVACIQKGSLEKFKALFDACNLHPDVVTTGSGYAQALAYAGAADPAGVSFFMDVEPHQVSIYAVQFGEIAFARTISLNSADPVALVKTSLMHTLLIFDEMFNNSSDLNEIMISGTASFIPAVRDDIEKQMAVPVHGFNIFRAAKISALPDSSGDPQYGWVQNAIAMGINDIKGAGGYNFTRHVSGVTLFYQENKLKILTSAVLLFFLFLAWAVNPVLEMKQMEKSLAHLDIKITQVFKSSFPDVKTIVDPVHQMQVKVDALKEKKSIDFFDEYLLCVDLLNEISTALPSSLDIVFSRFVRTENNLLVTGSADQFNTIDKMKNYFIDIASFKEVDINSAAMDKTDKRVKFNLKILL